RPEVLLPVVRVGEVRPEVEEVLGQAPEVGYAGEVRALARGELEGQRLQDAARVRHGVDHDPDVGVLRLEAVEQVAEDLSLGAVVVPGHAQLYLRGGGGQREERGEREQEPRPGPRRAGRGHVASSWCMPALPAAGLPAPSRALVGCRPRRDRLASGYARRV